MSDTPTSTLSWLTSSHLGPAVSGTDPPRFNQYFPFTIQDNVQKIIHDPLRKRSELRSLRYLKVMVTKVVVIIMVTWVTHEPT